MVRSASCSMGLRTPIAKNFYSEVNEPRYCSEPWELGVHTFMHTHTRKDIMLQKQSRHSTSVIDSPLR